MIEIGEEERFDFSMPQTMYIEMMRKAGIATLDLLPWFREASDCQYLADGHRNPTGHALAASVIAEQHVIREAR